MQIRQEFLQRFGHAPAHVVWTPGRVNLIGEHTDYNDGFVLPAAIDRGVFLAIAPRRDRTVNVHALNFQDATTFSLDALQYDNAHAWSNYLQGVAMVLQERGYTLQGMDAVLWGNLPVGASLSSSAAVEVATAFAFKTLAQLDLSLEQIPALCQRAENVFVGVNCGIMDQFAVTLGQRDHALFLDCRTLDYQRAPLPSDIKIVVCDTRKPRTLAASAYNQRRAECEAGAQFFGVKALRDVSIETFRVRENELPEIIRQRVRHVVTENQRVLDTVAALERGDKPTVGALMAASHASLRDDYAVSVRELDVMVELAQAQAGCIGARMTGAGFGGAAIALVQENAVDDFVKNMNANYQRTMNVEPLLLVTRAQDGVRFADETEGEIWN
jgi:galactokinase